VLIQRISKENVGTVELDLICKNGRRIPTEYNCSVINDHQGHSKYIIAIGRDLRERKKVAYQLQQSQKMEAIGTLAGGIAHDFNNLLSVITGNISYALNALNIDDERHELLSEVLKSSKQAQKLTYQLLTFSKGGEPVKKISNINKILEESAIFSTSGAKTNCRFEFADDLWLSDFDEGQMNQVFSNLIINANQAMPNGGTIRIKTQNTEVETDSGLTLSAGPYIKIMIEDQGIGIHKQHLHNIFEPYYTTKQNGNGLGLAIVYSIITKHEGHIDVYSEVEKGTVFNIYLPALIRKMVENIKQKEINHVGQGRILIMDDQEPILKMAGRMLNRMGYETDFAFDGSETIEKYRKAYHEKNPFDIVILDLTIPGGMAMAFGQ